MSDIEVPVLIVGGGGAGLTASMTLSTLGVDSLLVSAMPNTSTLPKAHVLNQRAMEILTEAGVAPEIYKRSTPAENMVRTGWYAGLAGKHEDYGRLIGALEVWGGGYTDPDYIAASPYRTCNLPQIRLEPVLRDHAEKLNPGNVRFNNELVDLVQDDDGVTATILDKDAGSEYTVRAEYAIAADGGRTVGNLVGVTLDGPRDIMKLVSCHITADLSQWATDDDVLIRWLVNPDFGGAWSGVLVPMGPDHWGPKSEEWVFHMQYANDDPAAMQPEAVKQRMYDTLGLPADHPVEIHKISPWSMEGVIADKFRSGRVFVVGDAAHRHPPTGGLGLTSAMADVYNLGWKLAAVLAGRAGDELLDTYEAERKPVDQNNIDNAIANAMNHAVIDQALSLSHENTPEQNWAELAPLWHDGPKSVEKRAAVNRAVASQTIEFHHHNTEFGYRYDSTAVVPDGSADYVPLDAVRLYEPSTKPGSPLPHAYVEREGERFPLVSLVHGGNFLVLAGPEGRAWVDAANKIAAENDLPIVAGTVGIDGADLVDVRFSFLKNREIADDGVLLVRPDRYIAFRSMSGVEDPTTTLRDALASVLSTDLR
ncbi:FAD-dependent monooxygenase [Nocardioides sp. NPDC057767]|uniref:FAD-dependent monooxygenase n=1 Tax=unclassified Nocardioides TaxID=2615069 RepID=UPI00366CACD1